MFESSPVVMIQYTVSFSERGLIFCTNYNSNRWLCVL